MSTRLSETRLESLPPHVAVPRYDRIATGAGIVHLGLGAFHRAHQAWYTEQVLSRTGGDWGIVGASLRSSDVRDRLMPQDGLYTVVERDGERSRCTVVGAIQKVLVGPDEPGALVEQLAHPDIRVITLTITEKGYYYDAGSGDLQWNHPDIRRDLQNFRESPSTAIGYLAAGLARRRQLNRPGVTLLSCDNLPHNGRVLESVIKAFIAQVDPDLLAWMENHVTFPCSMVDRIVPATTTEDLAALEGLLGCRDEAGVFTESFSQWVVEDNFARGAPPWQDAGVLLTDDVAPFETMKLRLLNGSHSIIAYLGHLAGHDFVHQVMADDHLRELVARYMDRQAQLSLTVPEGFDIDRYKESLLQRFANTALNHRTYQIAQDGSQKIPQRWLASVRDLRNRGQPTSLLALAVAGWIRYLGGRRDNGHLFAVDDPLADELQRTMEQGGSGAVLRVKTVFGDLAARYPDFLLDVEKFGRELEQSGVASTVARVLSSNP